MQDAAAPSKRRPHLADVGLAGVLVTFSDQLSEAANRAALAFRAELEVQGWAGVEETSTSLTSVFLRFDPLHLPHAELKARLGRLLESRDWYAAPLPERRRHWRIPTVYGGALAPQLAATAARAGMSIEAAEAGLSSARLRVLTIGFAPGQPYLGTLPPAWDLPRQSELTPRVPEGALVLAIRQLVLFAAPTPTGWAHVGQTAFRCFRPESAAPFALRPGDEATFFAVGEDELARIRAGDASGDGGAVSEVIR